MKTLGFVLLAIEAVLAFCVIFEGMAGNTIILLLASNSVLLIWTATRLRRKPSCCR
jgi:hypothetical protein